MGVSRGELRATVARLDEVDRSLVARIERLEAYTAGAAADRQRLRAGLESIKDHLERQDAVMDRWTDLAVSSRRWIGGVGGTVVAFAILHFFVGVG